MTPARDETLTAWLWAISDLKQSASMSSDELTRLTASVGNEKEKDTLPPRNYLRIAQNDDFPEHR